MPRRTERIGSLIREIIADVMQTRLNDPRIPALTSVTRVDVTADCSVARVYVSVMVPEITEPARRRKRQELCLQALRSAAGHLRRQLGRELRLRKTPQLDFRLDDSVKGSFDTVQLIDRVMAELDAKADAQATEQNGDVPEQTTEYEAPQEDAQP